MAGKGLKIIESAARDNKGRGDDDNDDDDEIKELGER